MECMFGANGEMFPLPINSQASIDGNDLLAVKFA